MCIMAYLYDMRNIVLGLFAGDDNVVFGVRRFRDQSQKCAATFNLESKFLNKYYYSYFCSPS